MLAINLENKKSSYDITIVSRGKDFYSKKIKKMNKKKVHNDLYITI